ncbi:MAG: PQQ-binding-like beta-propeller repeat protein [Myxococcales bacterium]|nr:PQQ-binding-like beta-propeller repeat protein [Myxococcales bacterium]
MTFNPRRGWLLFAMALSLLVGCGAPQHVTTLSFNAPADVTARIKLPPPHGRVLSAGKTVVVATSGNDTVTLAATHGNGRVRWQERFGGGQLIQLVAAGSQLLLPTRSDPPALLSIDTASGKVRWQVELPEAATKVAHIAPYVAVQAGDQVLLIHGTSGTVDARWTFTDARLIGAGAPSWLWLYRHSPGAGEVLAIDIRRVRCAKAGCTPKVSWRTPFQRMPEVVSGHLCGPPLPRLTSCVDGRTGQRLWLDYSALLPTLVAGSQGLFAKGHDAWGHRYVAALSAQARRLVWRAHTSPGQATLRPRNGHLQLLQPERLSVFRGNDGKLVGALAMPTAKLVDAVATGKVLTWLFGSAGTLSPGRDALPPNEPPNRRPQHAGKLPPWLKKGVVLHYVEVHFTRRDRLTGGLVGAKPPTHIRVRLTQLDAKKIGFSVQSQGHKEREVTVSRDVPTELVALLPRAATPTQQQQQHRPTVSVPLGGKPLANKNKPARSGIHISEATLTALTRGDHVALTAEDPGSTRVGTGLHRVGYVGRNRTQPQPRDILAMVIRGNDARRRYLVAPWPSLPLVLRVDGAHRLLLLTAIVSDEK